MIFLIFADEFSGVLLSQAIDVCRHLQDQHQQRVRLITCVSLRKFRSERAKFKAAYPNTWVVPFFPRISNWRLNLPTLAVLALLAGRQGWITRGVLGTNLALNLRSLGLISNVCYDGRGAIAAEWNEYKVVTHASLRREIAALEQRAVQNSDFRIAVSQALVGYWQREFAYQGEAHAVIPCTVGEAFLQPLPSPEARLALRQHYGFEADDIVLVYSGSAAGWQSFDLADACCMALMAHNPRVKALLLAQAPLDDWKAYQQFPDRFRKDWLAPGTLANVLSMCDYGLLLREASVTNEVASPTKFAEYLARGLRVIISPGIGDFSQLTESNHVGQVWTPSQPTPAISCTSEAEREKISRFAATFFTKAAYNTAYQRVIQTANQSNR